MIQWEEVKDRPPRSRDQGGLQLQSPCWSTLGELECWKDDPQLRDEGNAVTRPHDVIVGVTFALNRHVSEELQLRLKTSASHSLASVLMSWNQSKRAAVS